MTSVIWPVVPNNADGTYTFNALQDFGDRDLLESTYHHGLDFGWNAYRPKGTPVVAIAPGVVVERQDDSYKSTTLGNFIRVRHDGYDSRYCHMVAGSHTHLGVGATVNQGTRVGNLGDTGSLSFGEHLHLDIYVNDVRIDPQAFIRSRLGGAVPIEEVDPVPDAFQTTRTQPITLQVMNWVQVDSYLGTQWPLLPYLDNSAATNIAEVRPSATKFDVSLSLYVSNLPEGAHVGVRLGIWNRASGAISGVAGTTFTGNASGRLRGNYSQKAVINQAESRLCVQAYASVPGVQLDLWRCDGFVW